MAKHPTAAPAAAQPRPGQNQRRSRTPRPRSTPALSARSAGRASATATRSSNSQLAGAGVNLDWISASHAQYLAMGGVDGFVGDGALTPAVELSTDLFYSVNVLSSVWLSGDFQHIVDPGYCGPAVRWAASQGSYCSTVPSKRWPNASW